MILFIFMHTLTKLTVTFSFITIFGKKYDKYCKSCSSYSCWKRPLSCALTNPNIKQQKQKYDKNNTFINKPIHKTTNQPRPYITPYTTLLTYPTYFNLYFTFKFYFKDSFIRNVNIKSMGDFNDILDFKNI